MKKSQWTWSLVLLGRILVVSCIGYLLLIISRNEFSKLPGKKSSYFTDLGKYMELSSKYYNNTSIQPDNVSNNVFYVWCGHKLFEFRHYISILSVIKELQPFTIIFYYNQFPQRDKDYYNTWFQEIRNTYPFLQLKKLTASQNGCLESSIPNMAFIYNLLKQEGGLYVNEDTIFDRYPLYFRNLTVVNGIHNVTSKGFLQLKTKQHSSQHSEPLGPQTITCASISTYTKDVQTMICINIDNKFSPKDIWELDNDFGRLVRQLFYGNPEINLPAQNYEALIPNIAHIIWIGGGTMDYLFYLCVLSLLYIADVDTLYIHGDLPTGTLWDTVKNNTKIHFIQRKNIESVFEKQVNRVSHISDVWRVDIMIRYGGIYIDTDAIFVKPLSKEMRSYDAVASLDFDLGNLYFPGVLNLGVTIGKRNAKFWHILQNSMKWFRDEIWSWNGLLQPYRIKERYPHLMQINSSLQVICFFSKCHPSWWPNFRTKSIHHLNTPMIKNWRNDTNVFHFTHPTPSEFMSEHALLESKTMIGEIGRYILRKANRLKEEGQ